MNSAHMEMLQCIIVHGTMPSVPNSASPSLATPMICAILLMLVTARFLLTEMDYLQTFNIKCEYNDRLISICTQSEPTWRRKRRIE